MNARQLRLRHRRQGTGEVRASEKTVARSKSNSHAEIAPPPLLLNRTQPTYGFWFYSLAIFSSNWEAHESDVNRFLSFSCVLVLPLATLAKDATTRIRLS